MRAVLIMLGGIVALAAIVLGILALMHKVNVSVALVVLFIAMAMIEIGKKL